MASASDLQKRASPKPKAEKIESNPELKVLSKKTIQRPQNAPNTLVKVAATQDELQQHIYIIKNSTDQQKISEALNFMMESIDSTSLETKKQIIEALIELIPKYPNNLDSTPPPFWTTDTLSKSNLWMSLNLLSTLNYYFGNESTDSDTAGNLQFDVLKTVNPFINSRMYSDQIWVYYNSIDVVNSVMNNSKIYPDSSVSELFNTLITNMMPQFEFELSTRTALVRLCKFETANLPSIIDNYKDFILKGKEYIDDRQNFLSILGFDPLRLTDLEYEKIAEIWASNMPQTIDTTDLIQVSSFVRKPIIELIETGNDVISNALFFKFKQMYDTFAEGNLKSNLGITMLNCIFIRPELADYPEFSTMFELNQNLVIAMKNQSPGGFGEGLEDAFIRMYEIIMEHKGEPIIKTLFEQNNITRFDYYPKDIIEHLYYDRDEVSEKPIMFMVFTKMSWWVNFGYMFDTFDYTPFDIRVIEPGSDERMLSMMQEASMRLGKKFRYLVVNGHGYPAGIVLKRTKTVDIPTELDISDVELLKQMKPLLNDNPDVILHACSTAGDNNGDINLAETIAKNLSARCFGAKSPANLKSVIFNGLELEDVLYYGAETGVYDYRAINIQNESTHIQPKMGPVLHSGSIFFIPAAENATAKVYDIMGRIRTRQLKQDTSGNLVWDSLRVPSGVYIVRVKEGEVERSVRLVVSDK